MNQALPLEPIFAPVPVPDNSLYLFLAMILLLFLALIWLYFHFFHHAKKSKKSSLEILRTQPFQSARESAYILAYYANKLSLDAREKKELEEILTLLAPYKYQKKSVQTPQQVQEKIQRFLEKVSATNV